MRKQYPLVAKLGIVLSHLTLQVGHQVSFLKNEQRKRKAAISSLDSKILVLKKEKLWVLADATASLSSSDNADGQFFNRITE